MYQHGPSASGADSSGNQQPKVTSPRPKRQRINPAVIHFTMAGFRASFDGDRELAEKHFTFAEALCRMPAK